MPSIRRARNWILICQSLNANNRQDLRLLHGLWRKGDHVALPHAKFLDSALIRDCHDSLYAGHLSVHNMVHNMRQVSFQTCMSIELASPVNIASAALASYWFVAASAHTSMYPEP